MLILAKNGLRYILGYFSKFHQGPMLRFLNIFAEKIGEKIGVFYSKQSKIILYIDHSIGS
jgi:hypothetical protein